MNLEEISQFPVATRLDESTNIIYATHVMVIRDDSLLDVIFKPFLLFAVGFIVIMIVLGITGYL
jgi:hypothetical protein